MDLTKKIIKNNVLFVDKVHPVLKSKLQNIGFNCTEKLNITFNQLLDEASNYTGIIIRSRFSLNKEFFDLANNLQFVGRIGSGMENIDATYAKSKDIYCINSPEGNRDAVGEHALGILLALMNNICKADNEIRHGKWLREENRGYEISGRTIGIIGYGNTGSAFAQRLSGFDAKVIAYDKYKTGFGNQFAEEVKPKDIFNKADIISMHVPLTDETRYMVNDKFFEKLNKPIYFINTSRGKVVDTDSLVNAIKNKKVIGAALDVLEYESSSFEKLDSGKRPDSLNYLINNKNIVLSPHVAGVTFESQYKLANVLYEKIEALYC